MLLIELKRRILIELVTGNDSFREHDLGVSNRFLTAGFLELEKEGYLSLSKNQLTPTYLYTVRGTQLTDKGRGYAKYLLLNNKTKKP